MDKTKNYNKGKTGEEMALKFLLKKGFDLVEQNYENYLGEIDLIMNSNDTLVFVEVKLKVGNKFGIPEEMIGKNKLSKIKRVAESYLVVNKDIRKKFEKYRIDAVCIVVDKNNEIERISHYENLY